MLKKSALYPVDNFLYDGFYDENRTYQESHRNADMREGDISCLPERQTAPDEVGGFTEGEVIGPAYGASFLLAKTEDIRSETPIEEDNWVAALEWADSLGADVVSSSLSSQKPYSFPLT